MIPEDHILVVHCLLQENVEIDIVEPGQLIFNWHLFNLVPSTTILGGLCRGNVVRLVSSWTCTFCPFDCWSISIEWSFPCDRLTRRLEGSEDVVDGL